MNGPNKQQFEASLLQLGYHKEPRNGADVFLGIEMKS